MRARETKAAHKAAFRLRRGQCPQRPHTYPLAPKVAPKRNVNAPLDGFWPSGQSHPWLNDLDPNYLKSYTPSHVL